MTIRRLSAVLLAAALVGKACSSATATDIGVMTWQFQRTGYYSYTGYSYSYSGYSYYGPQTAVAMADGKSWPVIFGLGSSGTGVNAYALTPIKNGTTGTYWNQIGTNVVQGAGILSAKSSPDGRVGVVLRDSSNTGTGTSSAMSNVAAVGTRSAGFSSAMTGVAAIAFDSQGTLVKASLDTLANPAVTNLSTIRSIAVSPWGNIGLVTGTSSSSPSTSYPIAYAEKSAQSGWQSSSLPDLSQAYAWTGDLAIDAFGRPVFAYETYNGSLYTYGVNAAYFDIMSGTWKQSTLASGLLSPVMPTIAADDLGGIGVAWMATNVSGSSSLMYSYKIGSKDWSPHTVLSSLVTSGTAVDSLIPQTRVGLDFDADNLPVLSFAGSSGNIWLAYDPIVPVPEPSTCIMALAGLACGGYSVWRRKRA